MSKPPSKPTETPYKPAEITSSKAYHEKVSKESKESLMSALPSITCLLYTSPSPRDRS